MIAARYIVKTGHIVSLEVKGHAQSGTGEYDMLCAAVSAITQTALLGLKNVVMADPKYTIRDGYLKIEVDVKDKDKQACADAVMLTLLEGLKDIAGGYPSMIKLEEVENVY
ncbi:MAG: ribosomal-processing cysteine protease Prp [Christensenellales bacterium]|jgi:uncharacterized protein YsxB (DUF464 family)